MKPLEGTTVVDLTRYGPGRFCTCYLADLGAEVITVETPRTDSGRLRPILSDETSPRYVLLNRNKRSITLNLRDEAGKDGLYRLIRTANVVVEGLRPGTSNNLGVD